MPTGMTNMTANNFYTIRAMQTFESQNKIVELQ